MSNRCAWIASLLILLGATAAAESPYHFSHSDAQDRVLPFGLSGWELFRPIESEPTLFDYAYLAEELRSEHAGLGIRFHSSVRFVIDFSISPFGYEDDKIGPVYDLSDGATKLTLAFNF